MNRSPKGWFQWACAICLLRRSPRSIDWAKAGLPPGTDPNKPPYWEIAIQILRDAEIADRPTQGRLLEYLSGQKWDEVPQLWRGQIKRQYKEFSRKVRVFNEDIDKYQGKEKNGEMESVVDRWLTGAKEISSFLGISRSTLYVKLKTWDVPVIRIDGRYMARKDRLTAWLEEASKE